jgi:hypothetical protein
VEGFQGFWLPPILTHRVDERPICFNVTPTPWFRGAAWLEIAGKTAGVAATGSDNCDRFAVSVG